MQQLTKLVCLALSLAGPATSTEAEVDVCSVKSIASLTGMLVSVRTRVGFNRHGMFILGDQCNHRLPNVLVASPGDLGAPSVSFQVDPDVWPRLAPFVRINGGANIACASIRGQFVRKRGFRLKRNDGVEYGNGFGPYGAFEFLFVIRSVDDIHNCP
jgi:hypothetical protein